MFSKILVPIDNSEASQAAAALAIRIASRFGSTPTGMHVYAGQLHDQRFRQMETGLPPRYQQEDVLQRQRHIHSSLIAKGLHLISESYLDRWQEMCQEAGLPCQRKAVEGKHYLEILKELGGGGYDLVAMGALGLGSVAGSIIGGTSERVMRQARCHVLLARKELAPGGNIVVALDGSPGSLAALRAALALALALGLGVEAVSVYDPHFHRVAFQSIASTLSQEAGQVFHFQEQERLHNEVIDRGLEHLYRGHLEAARRVALELGQNITTALLTGKPFAEVLNHCRQRPTSMLVVGRFGAHHTPGLDLGSTAENLARLAPCSVLLVHPDAGSGAPGG